MAYKMHTHAQRHKHIFTTPLLLSYEMLCEVFFEGVLKSLIHRSIIFALKSLDSLSWSIMEGLGVNKKRDLKVMPLHVDLIFPLMNSNLRQTSNSVFSTNSWGFFVCLFLSTTYLVSSHVATDFIFLPSLHWNF